MAKALRESQVVFSYGVTKEGPLLMFIVTQGAWEYLHGANVGDKHHGFDLTQLGIPLRAVIMRAKSQAEALEFVRQANDKIKDVRHIDLALDAAPGGKH